MCDIQLPVDILLLISNTTSIRDISSLFTTNKYYSNISNHKSILDYYSNKCSLPYSNTFKELASYKSMPKFELYKHAIITNDIRVVIGNNVKKHGEMFMTLAVKYNRLEIVKYIRNDDYKTIDLIRYAIDNNNMEMIKYLLLNGYNNIAAVEYCLRKEYMDIIDYMETYTIGYIKYISIPIITDYIHIMNVKIVKVLIMSGYIIREEDIGTLKRHNKMDIVEYIRNIDRDSLFLICIKNCNLEMLKFYIDNGYDVCASDIAYAIRYSSIDIIKYLVYIVSEIRNGASDKKLLVAGTLPSITLQIAYKRNDTEIIEYIKTVVE